MRLYSRRMIANELLTWITNLIAWPVERNKSGVSLEEIRGLSGVSLGEQCSYSDARLIVNTLLCALIILAHKESYCPLPP